MIAHHVLHVLTGEFLFRLHPEGQRLSRGITHDVGQPALHVALAPSVEEAPHPGLAASQRHKVGRGISLPEGEVAVVLTFIITLPAGKRYHVFAVAAAFGVVEGEATDAALVGVRRDAIVGHAQGHPHGALFLPTLAYHLHEPHLVLVGHGEGLALAGISVARHRLRHHVNGFSRRACPLQGDEHQTAVVHDAVLALPQLLAPAEGGLRHGHLPFVREPHALEGLSCFGYLAQVVARLVVVYGAHLSPFVFGSRSKEKVSVTAVVISRIRHDNATVA